MRAGGLLLLATILFILLLGLPAQAQIQSAKASQGTLAEQILARATQAALDPEAHKGQKFRVTIYVEPQLSARQQEWVNAHYQDPNLYILVDRQGMAWIVGQGKKPEPTFLTVEITIGSYCLVAQLEGSYPPISFSGAIGGTSGSTVDWYIFNNTYSQYWTQFNFSQTFSVEALWLQAGSTGPSCSAPYGSQFSYVKRYTWTVTPSSWTTSYAGNPAFQTQVQLPPEGNYDFYWIVHGTYYDSSGTAQAFHLILTSAGVVNQDPTQETNTLLGSILSVLKNIPGAILDMLKQFFSWLLNEIYNLLPQEVKDLLNLLMAIIQMILQIITAFANNIWLIAEFIVFFAASIPIIILIMLIHNPYRILDLIRWTIDLISQIIQAIRDALPIP